MNNTVTPTVRPVRNPCRGQRARLCVSVGVVVDARFPVSPAVNLCGEVRPVYDTFAGHPSSSCGLAKIGGGGMVAMNSLGWSTAIFGARYRYP